MRTLFRQEHLAVSGIVVSQIGRPLRVIKRSRGTAPLKSLLSEFCHITRRFQTGPETKRRCGNLSQGCSVLHRPPGGDHIDGRVNHFSRLITLPNSRHSNRPTVTSIRCRFLFQILMISQQNVALHPNTARVTSRLLKFGRISKT